VWGLEWVPCNTSETQYLALSGYRSTVDENHALGVRQSPSDEKSMKGCIQIWKYINDKPELDMCILHEFGVVYELKWMPYGGYESKSYFDTQVILTQLEISFLIPCIRKLEITIENVFIRFAATWNFGCLLRRRELENF
jgi:hypothetical protein